MKPALKAILLAGVISTFLASPIHSVADQAASEMTAVATAFLNALDDKQHGVASFDFGADERLNWHFVPKERKGLPLNKMGDEQKALALALLATGTSRNGQLKALTIMSLEKILQVMEGPNRRFSRDPALYHVSIFGAPSNTGTWGWRFEGHHLSLNYTIVKGRLTSGTPSFYGTNPAHVKSGPRKGLRVLGVEEDTARALVKSLRKAQLKKALVGKEAPQDIFTSADRKVGPLKHQGIRSTALNWHQKELLMEIVEQYATRNRAEIAEQDLEKIEAAGIENIYFAWMGGLEEGEAHYYSIQGPTFLLEYDNIQNDTNHIHATWRDFENDFGIDILKQHYESVPHN
ncbi:MAG: hypothetical protein M2R45_02257 [Verrucomicrobia subdivision 3 bacterium]|nr:hypothetical protein [Limisphaerales bacterium]MCS1413957.1 hypothetical protein [Limisphaerales bacterium]